MEGFATQGKRDQSRLMGGFMGEALQLEEFGADEQQELGQCF